MSRFAALLFSLFLIFPLKVAQPAAPPPPTVAALPAFADQEKLWEEPQWLALGHYTKNTWGEGWTSRIDSPLFFLASSGKTDPRAELRATLMAFFGEASASSGEQTAPCRYPARYQWLRSRLPATLLPDSTPSCPELEYFPAALTSASVSLIFPESYLKNPASLFGHILLRIDPIAKNQGNPLLGYAVNFGARTGDPIGLPYAYKGLFGKYKGRYSFAPYSEIVKEYGDMEHRDIWEYPLRLSRQETSFLLLHLRELHESYFDYYFLDENCAFQILALLETVRPSLELTKHFPLWTIPGDTLIILAENSTLLSPPIYRPSLRTRLGHQIARLDNQELEVVQKLIKRPESPIPISLTEHDPQSAARILDTAADYLLLTKHESETTTGPPPPGYFSLLGARSLLNVDYSTEAVALPSSPEQAMGSGYLGSGVGLSNNELFWQFDLRPAYFDRFDPPIGHQQGAYITFLEGSVRMRPTTGEVSFNHFILLDIAAFPPFDTLLRTPSGRIEFGFFNDRPGHPGLIGALDGALGISQKFGNKGLVNIGAAMEIVTRETALDNSELYLGAEINAFYNFMPTAAAGLTLAVSDPISSEGSAHHDILCHTTLRVSEKTSLTLVYQMTRSSFQSTNLVRLMSKFSF